MLAQQGGALAEGLPRALRRAVALDRVPNDIKPDLLFLARLLDPVAARLKAMAPDLPRMAANARGQQLEPQADKAYEVGHSDFPPYNLALCTPCVIWVPCCWMPCTCMDASVPLAEWRACWAAWRWEVLQQLRF